MLSFLRPTPPPSWVIDGRFCGGFSCYPVQHKIVLLSTILNHVFSIQAHTSLCVTVAVITFHMSLWYKESDS